MFSLKNFLQYNDEIENALLIRIKRFFKRCFKRFIALTVGYMGRFKGNSQQPEYDYNTIIICKRYVICPSFLNSILSLLTKSIGDFVHKKQFLCQMLNYVDF